MPVITTAFDQDFFEEPLTDTDRSESPCKRKCRKRERFEYFRENKMIFRCRRMRYEYLSTRLRSSQSRNLSKSLSIRLSTDFKREICRLFMFTKKQYSYRR